MAERMASEGNNTLLHAGNWEWYYPENSESGESIASIAGYSAASVSSMRRHAAVMAQEADNVLAMAGHRPDVERSQIGVLHMGERELGHPAKLDSVVYLAAPPELDGRKNMWAAAQSIEFGHVTKDGETQVPAVAPLQKAAKKMVAKRRMSIK